jgi:iron(III) transport system permease protein
MTAATTASDRAVAAARDPRAIARSIAKPLGIAIFIGALGYLVLEPLIRLQSKAFADGAQGYRTAFTRPGIGTTIITTVELALGSLAIALVLGTFLAWCASRLPPRMRILRVIPVLPIVVPAIASVVGWAFLLSPRPGYLNAALRNLPWWSHLEEGPIDIYTVPWIVIITGIGLTAFVYLFVSAGFENISAEQLEAAQIAGSSPWGVFFRVTLPLLRPTLIYGGGIALLLGLGQFTAPLLLGTTAGINVITTDIYRDMSQVPVQYASAAALGSTLLVFGVVVVMAQKLLLGNQRRFVTHGGKGFRAPGRPSRLAGVALLLYTTVATVLPVGALIIVSLTRFWSAKIDVGTFTLDNYRQIFRESNITDAIYNSVTCSLLAVLICLPIGFIAASIILRGTRFRPLRIAADFVVSIPLGVPAVLFGAGFLLTYTEGPFVLYGTRWVIVLVYVTLMLPFATRMQLAALVSLGDSYIEAARVSGSGVIQANLKVVVPLLRSALGGAAALMFVLLTHEFAASVLVRSSTTQVMGTVLFDYWTNGSYPLVAAIALIMSVVTGIGVILAIIIGGSKALSSL